MALTTIRTLNQVQEAFKRIATAHLQLRGNFYWGPTYDFATSGDTGYPCMLVDVLPGTINKSTLTVNLQIHILDKERAGKTNEDDIQSDCLQIAKDVMAEIKNDNLQGSDIGWSWEVDKNQKVSYELFQYTDKDILAGVLFKPTITLTDVDDTCQIPQNTIIRF